VTLSGPFCCLLEEMPLNPAAAMAFV